MSTLSRPGVSPEALAAAGVRHVDAAEAERLTGYASPGLLLPYLRLDGAPILTPDGDPFCRLRLDKPTGNAKYLSPKGSGAQVYFPPGLRKLLPPHCDLYVVEGEFKAMSLVEANFAAVGVGGISSACRRDGDGEVELLPDIAALIDQVRPARILFCGDSDTALIADFSREAVKLAQAAGVPVVLPRIPLDSPGKAPDDLRELLRDQFPARWREIIAASEPVADSTKPAALAVRLLRREEKALAGLTGDAMDGAKDRLVKLGAAFREEPVPFAEITEISAKIGLGKQTFRAAVRAHADAAREAVKSDRQRDAVEAVERAAQLYFDGSSYWRQELNGEYGRLSREDARLHLGVLGFSFIGSDGCPSPAEFELHRIQQRHRVGYAGALCGRPPGVHIENGIAILATRGPKIVEGKPGEWPTLQRFLENLFGKAAGDPWAIHQGKLFVSWLKLARIALRDHSRHRPGQVLAVVGPPDCGKTLLQTHVITPALGGRAADPGLWFTGGTMFNADLFGAEHLLIGDKSLGDDGRERARLRDELKRCVASADYPMHGKNKDALTVRPVWRISLSANSDPDSAISLPALDASFSDKIIYLLCHRPPAPLFDPNAAGGFEAFCSALVSELPAFLAEVDAWRIPPDLTKTRFGVVEWHHPAILDLLEHGSALVPLQEVLEKWIAEWPPGEVSRAVTTTELYSDLDHRLRGIVGSANHFSRELARVAATAAWQGRLGREVLRVGNNRQRQTTWVFRRAAT